MNFRYTKALAAVAILMAATSCTDDKWEPGPDVAPDCMSVYFEPISNYNLIVEPDDSRLIPVTVGRSKTNDAATVNLIVNSCPEGVVVPQSVSFEAGEQAKTVFIDIENMASKSSGTISIAIPENMVSPYSIGNAEISLNVTISGSWLLVARDATVSFTQYYADMKTNIYVLDGTHNFKLPNFLGTGFDFTFTVDNPGSGNLGFVPLTNFIDVHDRWGSDYTYNGWFLIDPATATYAQWSPDGSYPGIQDMEFDSDFSYINVAEGIAHFSTYTTYTDGSAAFMDANISFTPLFDPFAIPGE